MLFLFCHQASASVKFVNRQPPPPVPFASAGRLARILSRGRHLAWIAAPSHRDAAEGCYASAPRSASIHGPGAIAGGECAAAGVMAHYFRSRRYSVNRSRTNLRATFRIVKSGLCLQSFASQSDTMSEVTLSKAGAVSRSISALTYPNTQFCTDPKIGVTGPKRWVLAGV